MRQRLDLPPVEVNVKLLEIEARLTELLEERAASTEDAVHQIVNAIEASGGEGYFISKAKGAKTRRMVEVLALDIAWVTPGPHQTWGTDGKQVCFCRLPAKATEAHATWYARSLHSYFGEANARSLLSLPSVYSRKSFVRVKWLTRATVSPSRVSPRTVFKGSRVKVWSDAFHPVGADAPKTSEWEEERLGTYKTLILRELREAVPSYDAADAVGYLPMRRAGGFPSIY